MTVLRSEAAKNWLRQFPITDQELAANLLRQFVLVSRDELSSGLVKLVLDAAGRANGPIGLYAERELPEEKGTDGYKRSPALLFPQAEEVPKRAYGEGPSAVQPSTAGGHDVGSEGIIAQLITQLCRNDPKRFHSHPGPKIIRGQRLRHLWVLTDLIGSGTRARAYLEAMWRVASVRSWWSSNFIEVGVLAYAAIPKAANAVGRHPSKPTVLYVRPCPTIATRFMGEKKRYAQLCEKYDPTPLPKKYPFDRRSLGFGNAGALIAFSHGAPNNVPNMFHRTGKARPNWIPLFPSRVTMGIGDECFGTTLDADEIRQRLERMGQKVLARSPAASSAPVSVKKRLLILAALTRGNRQDVALAQVTGLTLPEVASIAAALGRLGWIDPQKRLTEMGHGELRKVRRQQETKAPVDEHAPGPYYPKVLRSPDRKSSRSPVLGPGAK